jgi:hypothetical protein
MKTCEEIRHANLLRLIEEAGGEAALAGLYECSEAYIKQMKAGYKDSKSGTPKGIGAGSARKLESCTGKERGWMDHEHGEQRTTGQDEHIQAVAALMEQLDPTTRVLLRGRIEGWLEQMSEPGRNFDKRTGT